MEIKMIGFVFGKRTIAELAGRDKWGNQLFKCVCICGSLAVLTNGRIKAGKSNQCDPCRRKDLIPLIEFGTKFKDRTIIGFAEKDSRGNQLFSCQCKCGSIKNLTAVALRKGTSGSCDSCSRESRKIIKGSSYRIWQGMKERCSYKKHISYKNYGGRGITVCDRWLESFENFLNDMGERPEGLSIDRIDNEKGYSKDNCRWATQKEQTNNTRRNLKNRKECFAQKE